MSQADEHSHQEIIIIKRGSEEEEDHHGGAWKIAFADFMTAMMALFLVLWLINAANEETKRAVASYFNPVKLVDRNRSTKGLDEQKGGPTKQLNDSTSLDGGTKESTPPIGENSTSANESQASSSRKIDEQVFFANPNEAIETIRSKEKLKEIGGTEAKSVVTEFADPFAPDFWKQTGSGQNKPSEASTELSTAFGTHEKIGTEEPKADQRPEESQKVRAPIQTDRQSPERLKAEINKSLHESSIDAGEIAGAVHVERTDQGILISITDTIQRPMFAVGSAVPEASMVIAIDAVAKSLSKTEGDVLIFGHTDSRPFQKQGMSNWKLSTDRSNAAYFMLLHGGLAEERISEISGFADRKLRNSEDPFAGENRRIEVLLVQQ